MSWLFSIGKDIASNLSCFSIAKNKPERNLHIFFIKVIIFLIIACYDLLGWIEAKLLYIFSSQTITNSLWKNVIYWHRCFKKLLIDGRSENKEVIAELVQRYRIKKVVVLAYHLQANEVIECGYKPIVNTLSKMLDKNFTNWMQNLAIVFWADQLTVYTLIGLTLYHISYDNKLVFPIKLEIPT